MESQRQKKAGRLIQKELGAHFQRAAASYTPGAMISVTVVRMSPDLSVARVYLSIFPAKNDKEKEKMLEDIRTRTPEIRKALGDSIRKQVRVVPQLTFYIDDSYDYAARIDELLK